MPNVSVLKTATHKLMMRELSFGPSTVHDLVHVLKIAKKNVQHQLNAARKANLVAIIGWQRNSPGDMTTIYGIKKDPRQKDVARPKKFTRAEEGKRYRMRKAGMPFPDQESLTDVQQHRAAKEEKFYDALVATPRFRGDCGSKQYRPAKEKNG